MRILLFYKNEEEKKSILEGTNEFSLAVLSVSDFEELLNATSGTKKRSCVVFFDASIDIKSNSKIPPLEMTIKRKDWCDE